MIGKILLPTAFILAQVALAPMALAEDSAAKQAGEKISEAAIAVKDFTVEQTDAAMKKAGEIADTVGKEVDVQSEKVAKEWDKLSDATADTASTAADDAKDVGEKAGSWFDRMTASAADIWEDVKTETVEFWDGLTGA